MGYRLTFRRNEILATVSDRTAVAIDATNAEAIQLAAQFSPVSAEEKPEHMRDAWFVIGARKAKNHRIRGGFGNRKGYMRFVDRGTRFMAGRFMTTRAIDIAWPTLGRRIARR